MEWLEISIHVFCVMRRLIQDTPSVNGDKYEIDWTKHERGSLEQVELLIGSHFAPRNIDIGIELVSNTRAVTTPSVGTDMARYDIFYNVSPVSSHQYSLDNGCSMSNSVASRIFFESADGLI